MNTVEISEQAGQNSPTIGANIVAAYYLLTIVTGIFVLFFHGKAAFAVDLMVGVFYLVVTAFLYGLSSSANNLKRRAHNEDL